MDHSVVAFRLITQPQIIHRFDHGPRVISFMFLQFFRHRHNAAHNLCAQIFLQFFPVVTVLERKEYSCPPEYVVFFIHIIHSVRDSRTVDAFLHKEFQCTQRASPVLPVTEILRRPEHYICKHLLLSGKSVFQDVLLPVGLSRRKMNEISRRTVFFVFKFPITVVGQFSPVPHGFFHCKRESDIFVQDPVHLQF